MIYQTSTSRIGYGLARNRHYPPIFQWTDRRGVPWFSLIVSFLAGLVFLLPFPGWHSLVNLITSATVLGLLHPAAQRRDAGHRGPGVGRGARAW